MILHRLQNSLLQNHFRKWFNIYEAEVILISEMFKINVVQRCSSLTIFHAECKVLCVRRQRVTCAVQYPFLSHSPLYPTPFRQVKKKYLYFQWHQRILTLPNQWSVLLGLMVLYVMIIRFSNSKILGIPPFQELRTLSENSGIPVISLA